jgi:uncharacterized protein (TIGR00725 family)
MKVTVFGGSNPTAGSPEYKQAYDLGQLLAAAGHTVITGGYVGTMEAASRGANEAGGHVIGITCQEIENYRSTKANDWVLEEIRYDGLKDRINGLIHTCDAALALPGGVGTLAEISLMWNLLIIKAIPVKPLITIGAEWKSLLQTFMLGQGKYMHEIDHDLIRFADDIEMSLEMLSGWKMTQGR